MAPSGRNRKKKCQQEERLQVVHGIHGAEQAAWRRLGVDGDHGGVWRVPDRKDSIIAHALRYNPVTR